MKRKLFAFDLDGTLLYDSKEGKVSENVKKEIKKLINEKHIVCIFTGRPWRATKKIYEDLKLDTIVANYNGGHVHNPKSYDFLPLVRRVELNHVMKILNSEEIKKIANNIVVEGPGFLHIEKIENSHFEKSFIQTEFAGNIKTPINYMEMNSNPTGVLIEVKKEFAKNINNIKNFFKSKFGDLVSFTYWDTSGNSGPILEFTNYKARKDIALIQVARHYNVDMSDTIAFGDGFNDVEMLKVAGVGVAMSNANEIVKSYANVVSKHPNTSDGVAKFIKWYVEKGNKLVEKTIYSIAENNDVEEQMSF